MSSDPHQRAYYNSLIVPKGFIALDGASLTVCEVNRAEEYFTLVMIPHTQELLKKWSLGDLINIELDCMAKYVHSTMESVMADWDSRLCKTEQRMTIVTFIATFAISLSVFSYIRRR